jgi:signal transduction histidine kinase
MFPTCSFSIKRSSAGATRAVALKRLTLFWFGLLGGFLCSNIPVAASGGELIQKESSLVVTNVAQFRSAPREIFLGRCAFQLAGLVTLVDTNRDLLVLQDETGAVALNPKMGLGGLDVQVGQQVLLAGSRCVPYVVGFPNYPFRPSGFDVRASVDAPANWGQYYLNRLRGYLSPPVTGEYTFWTASDNSSEVWLSSDEDPAKVKRIAFLSRYSWVAPREWSHFPSQRSEAILLQAGQRYYIEAFHEQTVGGDHMAVAWQGPSVKQGVIANRYLTPWIENRNQVGLAATNGMVREYWTNFSLGGLAQLTGPRSFESILSVDELRVTAQGVATWPKPRAIALQQPLRPEDNFVLGAAQGRVTFTGREGALGFLELSDGEAQLQVRGVMSAATSLQGMRNSLVRVAGVCEGVYDQKGVLVPGLIWVAQEQDIAVVETAKTNLAASATGPSSELISTNSNPAMIGYYGTRGVVTFNDRVFGKDAIFIQEETAVMFVSLKDRNFENKFEVGRWIDLGGGLQPGKHIPTLSPMAVTELGWRALPGPLPQPVQFPVPGSRDGRWTQAEGVVHTVNSNGTITLMGRGGSLAVWIGKTSPESLRPYVDAKLRVRGVLSLTLQDAPLLLVPAPSFVEVEREAPGAPFSLPTRSASDLLASSAEPAPPHRVKLAGQITFSGKDWFFLQDPAGGVRVQPAEESPWQVGQAIEAVGFPRISGAIRTLTQALIRPAVGGRNVPPQKLDAGESISLQHAGALVQISAKLIAQRSAVGGQVLELQEKQRVFEAELPPGPMGLPAFEPGSRLQLIGVCDFATAAAPAENAATESPSTGALKIWLRSPADVVLVSGPPWWTWRHTAVLVGLLFTVLVVSLLRIHLLRRRLERQLAFSRQILESQEGERHRIAANLHDSLGQNLLVIKNQARLAMQPVANESVLRQRLDEISGCATQAIEEVREITQALRPYQLDRLGLTQTIRATVSRAAENSSILFASHADDIDGLFDKESEIHVYRIVQEAVNNILKHSAATEATVVVKKQAAVSLSIRDNGRGFDAGAAYASSNHDVGHGLSGIKERVRILGGTFVIDSRPDHGAILSIEIPISVPMHEAT